MRGTTGVALAVLVLALVSRLALLELRPLHHDEGVNWWFSSQLLQTGQFRYDPTNYHGPVFFFALFFTFLAFGVSAFTLRWPAALAGIGLVAAPLAFRRVTGWTPAVASSALLLLSPSVTYYSRYAIHESTLLLASVLAVGLTASTIERRTAAYLPLLGATAALVLATKETGVLVLAVLGLLALLHWRRMAAVLRAPGSREALVFAVGLFALLYVTLFSSFFTNPAGVWDAFRAFTPWAGRGFEGAGHDKPWLYYLQLLASYEWPMLLLAAVGLLHCWRTVWGRALALWAAAAVLGYSALDYKTPWLLVNLTVPLALLGGLGYHLLPWRAIKLGVATVGALFLAAVNVQFNFLAPWQTGNPYAYVHTDAAVIRLADRIAALGESVNVLVHTDEYWPLPFYLRTYRVSYLKTADAAGFQDYQSYDAVILPGSVRRPTVPDGWQVERFRLRDGVDVLLATRPES